MGGNVFTKGANALLTPRMAPGVYQHIKTSCAFRLQTLFSRVATPIEAPEKQTFGDIDFLVSLEGSSAFSDKDISDPTKSAIWSAVEMQLEAVRTHQADKLCLSKNLALPWPDNLPRMAEAEQLATDAILNKSAGKHGQMLPSEKRFVQLDVQLCATVQELEWRLFKHAHGDFWCIMGTFMHHFGFTLDDAALCIRIPEIEAKDKKRARVVLTNDPTATLNFLGLPHKNGEFDRPFATVNDLFEYATTCKFFDSWAATDQRTRRRRRRASPVRPPKSDQRRRIQTRSVYARWVNEFVPAHQAITSILSTNRTNTITIALDGNGNGNGNGNDNDNDNDNDLSDASTDRWRPLRDAARARAFAAFPAAEQTYRARLAEWQRAETELQIRRDLIDSDACLPADYLRAVPAPQEGSAAGPAEIADCWRGCLRRALRDLVLCDNNNNNNNNDDDDNSSYEGVAPPRLRDSDGALAPERVRAWIAENWERVGAAAWRANCARAAVALRAKEEKRRMKMAQEANEAAGSVATAAGVSQEGNSSPSGGDSVATATAGHA